MSIPEETKNNASNDTARIYFEILQNRFLIFIK